MEQTITRKQQIILVSAKLFKQKGYEATTMRDIASAMEMEAASLYHHIKSKEQLLDEICFDMAHKLLDVIKEVNDIYFNAEERLRMAIRYHVQTITENNDFSAAFMHEWRSLAPDRLTAFMSLRDTYENEIKKILHDGSNEDVFEDVDLKFAALTILSTLNWVVEWYKPGGEMTPEQIADKLSDFILGGLRKKMVTDLNYKP
jgi:AcrR family transcriptional regulator